MQVTLIDYMGNDKLITDAARVSFSKDSNNYTEEENDKLISYLSRNGHFTPFTHPQLVIREKVPIFVARQRFKHTVGFSYNEVSRRYVNSPPEFYTPDVWRGKPVTAKQGSSDEVIVNLDWQFESDLKVGTGPGVRQAYKEFIEDTKRYYQVLISNGVAPEQARMVLPQSMYTEYFVTGSLSAWARAYKLRSDSHSQKEIQEVAKRWDEIIRPLFPVAWSALVD